jgi:hypothetical protein
VHVALTHRTQILLDDERHEVLQRRSAETGQSVGELIRRAIDQLCAGQQERDRAAAARRSEPSAASSRHRRSGSGEWADVEEELEPRTNAGLASPNEPSVDRRQRPPLGAGR